jgi:hypothetical protein
MKSVLTRILLLFALVVLAACGGGGGTPQVKVSKIEISPNAVLFTASGELKTLTAQVFGADNQPLELKVNWTSANPAVTINDTGEIQTTTNVGSSVITAEAGGVSAQIIVVIAEPVAGAKLISDSQILSEPEPVIPDQPVLVGSQLKVKLAAIPDLVPGTVLLASEAKPVAGKVISVVPRGEHLDVVFEALPIKMLFSKFNVSGELNSTIREEQTFTATAQPLLSSQADPNEFKLGPFTCTTSSSISIIGGTLTTKIEFPFRMTPILTEDEILFKVVGLMKVTINGSLTLGANLSLGTTCKQEFNRIVLPIGGALAYVAGFQIPYGAKFEIKASLQSPQVELGIEVKNSHEVMSGVRWTSSAGWEDLFDMKSTNEIKGKFNFPTSIKNFRIEGSVFAGGYLGLDLGSYVGQKFSLIKPLSILEASAGLKAEVKFGGVQDQMDDSGEDSAAKYELKAVLEMGLGEGVVDELKDILNKYTKQPGDEPGDPKPGDAVSFKTGINVETPLTRSPFGTASVDKNEAKQGEKVNFTIELDEKDVFLRPLPGTSLYNVSKVIIYRSLGSGDASVIKTLSASEGQRTFKWEWPPSSADVGQNKFWVFVLPKVLFENFELEINDDSKLEVKVSCLPGLSNGLAPQQTGTCDLNYTGTSTVEISDTYTYTAQVEWILDVPASTVGKRLVFRPKGSVTVSVQPGNGCTATVSPASGLINTETDGLLTIDLSTTPPTYFGNGATFWSSTLTEVCPDGTFDLPFGGGPWFGGGGTTSPDGSEIVGTSTVGGTTFTYSFQRK